MRPFCHRSGHTVLPPPNASFRSRIKHLASSDIATHDRVTSHQCGIWTSLLLPVARLSKKMLLILLRPHRLSLLSPRRSMSVSVAILARERGRVASCRAS